MNLELTIDAEFQSLIAPLTPQEFDLLKAQILEQGCLQPLCVWKTEDKRRILLDGHTRYRICSENNRRYTTINIRLASRDHARLWILEHQAGRRNLTDDQRAIVWNELREQRSRIVQAEKLRKARDAKAGVSISVKSTEIEQPKRDTRAEIAKEARLSQSKLRRAQKLKRYRPELYEKVLRGELTLRDGVKEFPQRRKKTEVAKNHDFFRHLGNLLDSVFKGALKEKLDDLVRIEPKEITPATGKNILEIISILADVSRHADGYASKLKAILQSAKRARAA
jgi:ParB-like chromosome segregation protein Spo0J